ncbi:MAG: HD-GYP domain-containing protein [Paenibacillus dendritiformis]|uniref:HD-GYP domain-containing protein n=1 Tax=Paenibacillus dendritiformis TaxID=130049 RepID=UPI00143DC3EB|nr:HD-GYP domain-containing protein [Paenibacillus dendritiformis]MDU5141780.1 HD-GYP domain-containing protein [Paenibacillus dendritiformis]NKI20288.1 HD-GYP domain-containing protein [Paenibacillus dendritiformis]NRG00170.1 HD-GYP domain-containing protein [Paenibacillus dendritiformis]
MVLIPVSQAKPGDRLDQDVRTMLGGVLMYKGRTLSVQDMEVLKAFMVKTVAVEGEGEPESAEGATGNTAAVPAKDRFEDAAAEDREGSGTAANGKPAGFVELWMQMVQLLKNVFRTASMAKLPILELRQQMEWLLAHAEQYSPLFLHPGIKELVAAEEADYLYHKSIAVALTSHLIGQWSGQPVKEGMQIALAGLLHDIGKTRVDEDIVNKQGALTDSERAEMNRHAHYAYEILRHTPGLNEGVKLGVLQHHERMDGSGYPLGVSGEKIHPYAKIVAVADMFHAMTLNRGYKPAASPYVVLEQLKEESFGKLDPQLVSTFIQKVTHFQQGSAVQLNDGRVGRIIFTEERHPTRPWVSVDGQIVHLSEQRHLWIEKVLNG